MPLRLYNTLTRRLEDFAPADPAHVTFYSCGPTVYDDAHIGNFRSFLAADLLRRWIESPLCEVVSAAGGASRIHAGPRRVTHVMNITDVGHMTDDADGGENGEDRMAVAGRRLAEAKKSGKLPPGVATDLDPNNPYTIAAFYAQRFIEDAKKLGLKLALEAEKDPSLMPRATKSIDGMVAMIRQLIASGHAYATGAPGQRVVYFKVTSFPAYGTLSGNTLEKLQSGAGGRVQDEHQGQKQHPADFLLWKEDPRHIMKWPSPVDGWGEGYPGWHIECSVMSASRLLRLDDFETINDLRLLARARFDANRYWLEEDGHHWITRRLPRQRYSDLDVVLNWVYQFDLPPDIAVPRISPSTVNRRMSKSQLLLAIAMWTKFPQSSIDLHSGGEDNIFPHHECEIAQTCCAFNENPGGATYARMWFHPRFLMVNGDKMSKSKGNFFTARDLFDKGHEPAALRLALISTHYRSNANFTEQLLKDAARMIERWRKIADAPATSNPGGQGARDAARLAFADALHEDLNIAGAIAAINTWVGSCDTPGSEDTALMKTFDEVLGVLSLPRSASTSTAIGVFLPGVTPSDEVQGLLEQRRAARAAKDFKKSDEIRDALLKMGYTIKDVAGGKVEVGRA
ncbi:MAG: cysteine--tRNA ligase [Planctomycetota bacterium]|nr:cysteine--tRNA ligase [Planctomycetota bacterium]